MGYRKILGPGTYPLPGAPRILSFGGSSAPDEPHSRSRALNLNQVVASGNELQDKIASALIEIVPCVVQYKVQVNLHAGHQATLGCVRALFTQTIIFLVKSREYFCLSKPRRLLKAAFSNDFDDILRNVQSCVGNLERALNSAARQGTFLDQHVTPTNMEMLTVLQHRRMNSQNKSPTAVVRNMDHLHCLITDEPQNPPVNLRGLKRTRGPF